MIKQAVLETIKKHDIPLKNRNVVVCVSGGADSMALLRFLHEHREELGILELSACHFNHGIRGAESDRDEGFVESACLSLGIELMIGRGNMASRQKPAGKSEEMWARELRRQFIDDCCLARNAVAAMAHTLSDSIETTLFNIARGTGIRGLRGIRPVYGNTVRPFIELTRQQIEHYCAENGISYVTDSTNLTDDYSRNYIRHNVVTAFSAHNPSFSDNIKRMMAHADDAYGYIDRTCTYLIDKARVDNGYQKKTLLDADHYIARCAVKKLLDEKFDMIDERMVDECMAVVKGEKSAVQIRKHFFFSSDRERFYISECSGAEVSAPAEEPALPGSELIWGHYRVRISEICAAVNELSQKYSQKECSNLVDYDKIEGNLVVRGRKSGDVFSPARRNGSKTLKKLFNELKIPVQLRDFVPLLADDSGVVWVMGQGASARVAADNNSKNIITIDMEELANDER